MSINAHSPVHQGKQAENAARYFLETHGLIFVAHNYQIKGGEIDLIMRDQQYLVFIEVKMRKTNSHGSALEMVSANKRRHIIRTAKHYLQIHELYDTTDCRFDVIGLSQNAQNPIWIKNAFEVQY